MYTKLIINLNNELVPYSEYYSDIIYRAEQSGRWYRVRYLFLMKNLRVCSQLINLFQCIVMMFTHCAAQS